jgi:hypothetical protein
MTLLEWAQFGALLAAALFFLAKAWAGFFVVNLTLDASASRCRSQDHGDIIVVSATLTRGGSGSLVFLESAAVRCSVDGGRSQTTSLLGMERLNWRVASELAHDPAAWQSSEGELLRIPVGESTTASCYFRDVPDKQLCVVEVVVIGRSNWQPWFHGQWRTSLICPPDDQPSEEEQQLN